MSALFKNNATALLAASISSSATTLVLSAGSGSLFPVLTGTDFFVGTIYDSSGNYEVVRVTARLTDSLTIVRGQEGTVPLSFNAGDGFAQRVTAGSLNDFAQRSANNTFTGINTFTDTINADTANFDGSITSVSPSFTGTPLAPTPPMGTINTQIATTAFVRAIIPAGVILMWSGSIASIPLGWVLCNGSNGTPNLVDRFIVGAGSSYGVGSTGGTKDAVVVSHSHTAGVSDPGHAHTISGNFGVYGQPSISSVLAQSGASGTSTSTTGISVSISTEGVSGTNQNLPPYYALAYIMKV